MLLLLHNKTTKYTPVVGTVYALVSDCVKNPVELVLNDAVAPSCVVALYKPK